MTGSAMVLELQVLAHPSCFRVSALLQRRPIDRHVHEAADVRDPVLTHHLAPTFRPRHARRRGAIQR